MADPTPSLSGNVEARLDRHAERRRGRLPTVSTLVGPAGVAARAWRRWAVASAMPPVIHSCADVAAFVPHLLTELTSAYDMPALALCHLHVAAGLPPPTPGSATSRSERDLEHLAAAAAAAAPDPDGASQLALTLCRGRPLSTMPASGPGRFLRGLAALLPADRPPAILLLQPGATGAVDDAAAWLAAVAGPVAQLAEAVPHWPWAVCVPAEALARFRADAPASRAKSLVLSGEVRLEAEALAPAELADRLRHALADSPGGATDAARLDQAARALAGVGATEAVVDAYAAAARLRPRRDDEARSAAERFLFELLELHPLTTGRFALNGEPGFRFGNRAAEVDLLAASLWLAVEVDGYHHFTEADAYRRDRRKDLELQRHGYVVVRVLADDVVARMDDVLDTVLKAVDHCGRRSEQGGAST